MSSRIDEYHSTAIEKGEALAVLVIPIARTLTDEERKVFFDELQVEFCIHCGRESQRVCMCTNDE